MFMQTVFPDQRLLDRFRSDNLPIYAGAPDTFKLEFYENEEHIMYQEEFGSKLRMPKVDGLYFDWFEHPLLGKSYEECEKYQLPDPKDPGRFRGLREKVEKLNKETDKVLMACSPSVGIFESSWVLRGLEQTFLDMVMEPKLLEMLADKVLEWMLGFWEAYLKEVGDLVQIVQLGEDLGGQNGPLFSPKFYREVYKPRHKALIDLIKKHTDAKIYLHSCGSVYQYIPDFIEIGIDVLNPIQFNTKDMEAEKLKKEFGKDMCFWGGGANPVTTLPKGTPKEVREEVKKQIEILGKDGGYVFASIHNMLHDIPPENVVAFFDAAFEYGVY